MGPVDRLYNSLALSTWFLIFVVVIVILYLVARVAFKGHKASVDKHTYKVTTKLEKTVLYFFRPKK